MDTRVRTTSENAQDMIGVVPAADERGALERRLEAFARQPSVGEFDLLISEWERHTQRVLPAERFALFAGLALRVRRGELPAWAVMPILLGDDDRSIVSAAATTVALSHRPDAAAPDTGPFCVLDHLLTPRARNPGAGLGALLGLGDAEVTAVIFDLRRMLAHPELATTLTEMLESSSGVLHRATVDFFLHWLDDLARDLPGSADLFLRVAHGLAIRRAAATGDFIIDGRPRYPAPLEGQMHEHGWCMIPLAEYTQSIASRLLTLEHAARGMVSAPSIAGPWGIVSVREEAEPSSG
jgi:hypothetical protein